MYRQQYEMLTTKTKQRYDLLIAYEAERYNESCRIADSVEETTWVTDEDGNKIPFQDLSFLDDETIKRDIQLLRKLADDLEKTL